MSQAVVKSNGKKPFLALNSIQIILFSFYSQRGKARNVRVKLLLRHAGYVLK